MFLIASVLYIVSQPRIILNPSFFFTVNLFDVCLSELLQKVILKVIFQTEGGRLLLFIKCLCS